MAGISVVSALTLFAWCERLRRPIPACLTVVLMLVGGDFSYPRRVVLPPCERPMGLLVVAHEFFRTDDGSVALQSWTPSMPVFFTALFTMIRGFQTRAIGWTLTTAVLMGVLFQFKPFAFVVFMAALVPAALFRLATERRAGDACGVRAERRVCDSVRLSLTIALYYGDRRSQLALDYFRSPRRMLIKVDLIKPFTDLANSLAPVEALRTPLFLLLANRAISPHRDWRAVARCARHLARGDESSGEWRACQHE